MSEATKSLPLRKAMQQQMPEAVIIKHRDASMIGVPDFSVTYKTRGGWFETKLCAIPKSWPTALNPSQKVGLAHFLKAEAKAKAPTQWAMLRRCHRTALGLYVIFVKKSFVAVVDPEDGGRVEVFKDTQACALFLSALMLDPESWWSRNTV